MCRDTRLLHILQSRTNNTLEVNAGRWKSAADPRAARTPGTQATQQAALGMGRCLSDQSEPVDDMPLVHALGDSSEARRSTLDARGRDPPMPLGSSNSILLQTLELSSSQR